MATVTSQLSPSLSEAPSTWTVAYSRFIYFPSLPSTCHSLHCLPKNRRYRPLTGTWLSTSSSTASASLQLLNSAVLSVSFNGDVIEEHYVSKLHFSWPQVACVPGSPVRGMKTVFVTYTDSTSEIQKFALRFSTPCEAEKFINVLKDIFGDKTTFEPLTRGFASEISSESVLVSSNKHPARSFSKELVITNPVQTFSQPPLQIAYHVEQEPSNKEAVSSQVPAIISPTLPPSFTSLMTNCLPEVKIAAGMLNVPEETIMKYIADSSFQDMLVKVEQIIEEIGDN